MKLINYVKNKKAVTLVFLIILACGNAAADVIETIEGVNSLLYGVAAGIATLMITIHAIKWKTGGSPADREEAKRGIINVILGLILIMIAASVVTVIYQKPNEATEIPPVSSSSTTGSSSTSTASSSSSTSGGPTTTLPLSCAVNCTENKRSGTYPSCGQCTLMLNCATLCAGGPTCSSPMFCNAVPGSGYECGCCCAPTSSTSSTSTTTTTTTTTIAGIPLNGKNLVDCIISKNGELSTNTAVCPACRAQETLFNNEGAASDYQRVPKTTIYRCTLIPCWIYNNNPQRNDAGCLTFPQLNERYSCGLERIDGYNYKTC